MSADEETRNKNLLKGIKSILHRRKYKIIEEEFFEDFINLHCELESDPNQKMFACISLSDKVGVKLLRDYHEKLEEARDEADEETEIKGLLVASNRFTHYARREAKQKNIWIITSKDPRFDIFTHDLVPEHVICPEEEVEELLEKYSLKREQLPRILITDPAVKAIGARPGQVVKIFRESLIAGEAVEYRLVVRRAT